MKNRIVGYFVIGIAALIGLIIYLFNHALTTIVNTSCSHGTTCPMWGTINFQTNISLVILILILLIGLYLIFLSKEEVIVTKIKRVKEQITPKHVTKKNYEKVMESLDDEEKKLLGLIIDSEGTIFQSDLVEKTKLGKVKVTRILDRLEGKDLIERKRRGMTNVVILKH